MPPVVRRSFPRRFDAARIEADADCADDAGPMFTTVRRRIHLRRDRKRTSSREDEQWNARERADQLRAEALRDFGGPTLYIR